MDKYPGNILLPSPQPNVSDEMKNGIRNTEIKKCFPWNYTSGDVHRSCIFMHQFCESALAGLERQNFN